MARLFVSHPSYPDAGDGAKSPMRAVFARLLNAFGAADRHAPAAVPVPVDEREFATEREAQAFARTVDSVHYRACVQQNAYDYSWSVEVYRAVRSDGTASNDADPPAAAAGA